MEKCEEIKLVSYLLQLKLLLLSPADLIQEYRRTNSTVFTLFYHIVFNKHLLITHFCVLLYILLLLKYIFH